MLVQPCVVIVFSVSHELIFPKLKSLHSLKMICYEIRFGLDLDLDFGYDMKLVLIWIWTWFWIWRIIQRIYDIVIDLNHMCDR